MQIDESTASKEKISSTGQRLFGAERTNEKSDPIGYACFGGGGGGGGVSTGYWGGLADRVGCSASFACETGRRWLGGGGWGAPSGWHGGTVASIATSDSSSATAADGA